MRMSATFWTSKRPVCTAPERRRAISRVVGLLADEGVERPAVASCPDTTIEPGGNQVGRPELDLGTDSIPINWATDGTPIERAGACPAFAGFRAQLQPLSQRSGFGRRQREGARGPSEPIRDCVSPFSPLRPQRSPG